MRYVFELFIHKLHKWEVYKYFKYAYAYQLIKYVWY